MNNTTRYLPFLGRLLIGGIFILSGAGKLSQQAGITAAIAHAGLPQPALGYFVALAVEIGVGLLLALGWRTRAAAAVLAVWCLVTAAFFHNNFADQNTMIHFLKNVMIAAGLLQIVHFGPGAISLDARLTRSS
ncbi:MAG TPA: DoxX family protein [Rhizomicrobium sp.]|nr:DoxX family protein [Rhizomicrobium sp.]